ncbi:MAG: peptide chain release factor 2 [Planctomycetes bacterium]|nr:peptide chain release factor 2 [Planctomycetota bacterium]
MATYSEIDGQLAGAADRLAGLKEILRYEAKSARLRELENRMAGPGFWNDAEGAQKVIRELKAIKAEIEPVDALERRIADARDLLGLAQDEGDESTRAALETESGAIGEEMAKIELRAMLDGEYDAGNAFVSVHAGAGGTESCDWAEMLVRMYLRWCEERDYKTEIVDSLRGEEAGVRYATFRVEGPWAYGYLRAEIGVHRLVRISPFDARKRRHTSFASVDVIPDAADEIKIDIRRDDLRIDTYRAGGAGGQHVNKTDSAVRITHLPTGIVVQCQNERSQHMNKATAMRLLAARLYRLEESRRNDELAKLYGEKGEIAFGSQIRSYVLQPYTMVKDHRTGHETGSVNAVLDGQIDPFIEAYLRRRKAEKSGT